MEAYAGHLHHHVFVNYSYQGHSKSASPQRHPKEDLVLAMVWGRLRGMWGVSGTILRI